MNELFLVVVFFFISALAIGLMYDLERRRLIWEKEKYNMEWVKK